MTSPTHLPNEWVQGTPPSSASRHCEGSMRLPTRTATVTGNDRWGICRTCGFWNLTRPDGTVKIHDSKPHTSPEGSQS